MNNTPIQMIKMISIRKIFHKKPKYKNLEEYIGSLKDREEKTVYITAYKRNQSWSIANPVNFGTIDVIIGIGTDTQSSENTKYVEYEIKVCEFDITFPLWPKTVYQNLGDKAREIKSCLEKNGLEGVLCSGFEWLKKKQKHL